MTPLNLDFYDQPTLTVARQLLGCYLIRDGCMGQIIETEAYHQNGDASCHAARGQTRRNAAMFLAGGHAYVYRIHQVFCLNVVTESEGVGSAVLIRALWPERGIELMQHRRQFTGPLMGLTNGPGKLCRALAIDLQQDGHALWDDSGGLWIGHGGNDYADGEIQITSRIGISKAQDLPWRFVVARPALKLPPA